MAINQDFNLEQGLVVPVNATFANVILSNTSSLTVGSSGVVINSSTIFESNTILTQNTASLSGGDLALLNTFQTIMSFVLTMPASTSSNYRIIVEWNTLINVSSAATRTVVSQLVDNNFTIFGYRVALIGLARPSQGIGGFAISPIYAPGVTQEIALQQEISSTLANVLVKEVVQTFMSAWVITST